MKFDYSAGFIVYKMVKGKAMFLFLIKQDGTYDVPKGIIEKGESAEDAATRETREEANVSVEKIPFFKRKGRFSFYKRKERHLKELTLFLGRFKHGPVKISYEHKGYKWMAYEEAMEKIGYKDLKEALDSANDYIRKKAEIDKINEDYSGLPKRAKKWNLSRTFVQGIGPVNSRTVFLGQAPGAEEDAQKIPFVGRSGKLLDSLLRRSGIRRDCIYITSVVQFFPPRNRVPSRKEIVLCMPFLLRQLKAINPKYIVFLGNVSASAFFNGHKAVAHHGKVITKDGVTYMFTLHPAAVLRFKKFEVIMLSDLKKFSNIMRNSADL